MTMALAFDVGLVALLIAMAVLAILVRDNVAAAIAFAVYGLLLALAWVRLAAVDVALTEAAIGSGVTGILLLGAAARLRSTESNLTQPSLLLRCCAGVFCALIAVGLAAITVIGSEPFPTLAPVAMASLAESGLGNPVAGVLFVYRALDTLLEKVVLLLALLGVWSVASDRAWGGIPSLRPYAQANDILVFLAQTLPPIGIMVGIYMCWVGANQPGGAFQGGAILAAMWLLVMMAGLQQVPPIDSRRMRLLLVIGPVIFLVVGLAGFVLAGGFLAYPAGFAKPLIIVVEVALTLSIGVTLGLLVAGPPERAQPP